MQSIIFILEYNTKIENIKDQDTLVFVIHGNREYMGPVYRMFIQ